MPLARNIDQQNLIETERVIWSFDAMREKSPQSLKSDEEHSIRPPCPRPLPVRISIESISLSSLFAFVPASFFFSPLKEKNMNYFLYFLCVPLFVFYLSFLLYS